MPSAPSTEQLTKEEQIIAKMHASYALTRKQITKALRQCNPGTAVALHHIEALSELDERERAEELKLGLTPANLGTATASRYAFISHVPVLSTDPAVIAELLRERDAKAHRGMHVTDEDNRIRKQLEREFGDGDTTEESESSEE